MFSDTCGGQNRNQNIAAVLFYAVQSIDPINRVEQKFLEQGHTYMECDSMHSFTKLAKKTLMSYACQRGSLFSKLPDGKIHIRSTNSATKISLFVRHFPKP